MNNSFASALANSRKDLRKGLRLGKRKVEAEGGCGVLGVASSSQIEGRYLLPPLTQMRNRGNGKGGGVALAGLSSTQLGVSKRVLEEDYMLQVAYLDESPKRTVEAEFIHPFFDVHDDYRVSTTENFRALGLEVKPPSVHRYFVRADESALEDFIRSNGLGEFEINRVEDEFIYQRTFKLNKKFYSSNDQKAFVLSSGKNMMVFKLVGYGEDVIRYYQLEDVSAHVWIGHHRYPTKGKVWHPGGAHPFVGLHHALVHNGDFSNYTAIANYLAQRNMYPLFMTDTEVAALLFDLWNRQYGYTDEILLEAMAPTTERDFYMLPVEKRKLYRRIQLSHISASPDGPWFFVIAGNDPYRRRYELYGITDTSMLRPQVFAVQDGNVKIGVIASERQVINALLRALAKDNKLPCSLADKYWNARGGSHIDGGAYIFSIDYSDGIKVGFTDKFGRKVPIPSGRHCPFSENRPADRKAIMEFRRKLSMLKGVDDASGPRELFAYLSRTLQSVDYSAFLTVLDDIKRLSLKDGNLKALLIEALTLMYDLNYDCGEKKRSSINESILECLNEVFAATPHITDARSATGAKGVHLLVDYDSKGRLGSPRNDGNILIVDSIDFPQQGDDGLCRFLVKAYRKGWKRFLLYNLRGHRFIGCGLGPNSVEVRIDTYGDIGDYVGSGIDGLELFVHGPGQDQALQIIKSGRAVFYGDVGQTFMYGAKGGEVFVLGNAAGRPMINAVGHPRVVINGTCLDYLAESFMAGDPLNGGGFVIVNAVEFDSRGEMFSQKDPYPGGNLLSLASGGAVYIRDPLSLVQENQLHGGEIKPLTKADWRVMHELLLENERLFGIS
ncbi:MAG: glutamate synthase, partial [Thermoplasmata archaeon]